MNRRTIFIFITVVIAACVAAVLSACNFLGNSVCGNNHEYGEITEIKVPTCTEEGEGKKVCSVCGYEKRGFVLPKKLHTSSVAGIRDKAT